ALYSSIFRGSHDNELSSTAAPRLCVRGAVRCADDQPPMALERRKYLARREVGDAPLGLLSVAAYVETKGYCVRVIDVHIEKYTAAELIEKLKVARPRFVGMSVMTATSNAANQIARIVKNTVPNCTVVFGGVHPEAMPAETLCNSALDIVVRGDGEETFLSIIEGKPWETITGISYRKGTTVVHNPASSVEMDLDKYPFPAYHLVPMDKYYPAIGAYKRLPAINMLMTRGCPGKCTFCNSAMTTLRTRSAESVVEEIEYLHKTYGVREIQFYDDTFTVLKKNVMRFCELMAAKGSQRELGRLRACRLFQRGDGARDEERGMSPDPDRGRVG